MKLIIILSILMSPVFAQNANDDKKDQITKEDWQKKQREIQRSLRQQLQKNNKNFDRFLNDDAFKQYDKLMKEMLEKMNESFKQFDWDALDQEALKDLNKMFKGGGKLTNPNPFFQFNRFNKIHKWIETKKERILELSIKTEKNRPLEINIEKGFVKVKGQFVQEKKSEEKNSKSFSKRIVTINESYPIPKDCDESKVKFKQKDDKILIIFPKKK